MAKKSKWYELVGELDKALCDWEVDYGANCDETCVLKIYQIIKEHEKEIEEELCEK